MNELIDKINGHPLILTKEKQKTLHVCMQAGATGLNERHWADGKALIHRAVEEEWGELLAWLVSSPAVDVNARTGGGAG